ncbi:ABC transporter permease [Treponema sp. OMZ 799]|uniref:ABC transporter permease n=1 Tax=Treponema sp. OMZ 799 TaxID=2563668 RepID=UPI0020A337BA|nr:ABC transporter permease [Treponema sp. OMZ 799]UTC76933.1 ABC transporter permease [Treponema sp. OMZ 799]
MKKYLSFFKIRFIANLQYRAAALAGISTQFAWGCLTIILFKAFYETSPQNFPMGFSAFVSYIWMQQAFLAFFAMWTFEGDITDSIVSGSIVYQMSKPIEIYTLWFTRSVAFRLARGLLRCFPVLIIAAILPMPYRLIMPDPITFLMFIASMILGLCTAAAFTCLIYVLCFFTVSPRGLQIVFLSASEMLMGQVIPIPFFPETIKKILEFSPFTGIQNIPLRIFSYDISSKDAGKKIILQVFWLIVLFLSGKLIAKAAEKKLVVQGG